MREWSLLERIHSNEGLMLVAMDLAADNDDRWKQITDVVEFELLLPASLKDPERDGA